MENKCKDSRSEHYKFVQLTNKPTEELIVLDEGDDEDKSNGISNFQDNYFKWKLPKDSKTNNKGVKRDKVVTDENIKEISQSEYLENVIEEAYDNEYTDNDNYNDNDIIDRFNTVKISTNHDNLNFENVYDEFSDDEGDLKKTKVEKIKTKTNIFKNKDFNKLHKNLKRKFENENVNFKNHKSFKNDKFENDKFEKTNKRKFEDENFKNQKPFKNNFAIENDSEDELHIKEYSSESGESTECSDEERKTVGKDSTEAKVLNLIVFHKKKRVREGFELYETVRKNKEKKQTDNLNDLEDDLKDNFSLENLDLN